MSRDKRQRGRPGGVKAGPDSEGAGVHREPIKVSLLFYLVSLVVVTLLVFILMLVQYLPGYRNNHRLSQVVKNSNVNITITIPMAEVEKREPNPFTKKQRDAVVEMFKNMGAKSATVMIEPDGAQ